MMGNAFIIAWNPKHHSYRFVLEDVRHDADPVIAAFFAHDIADLYAVFLGLSGHGLSPLKRSIIS
jgi:hypothetical protein